MASRIAVYRSHGRGENRVVIRAQRPRLGGLSERSPARQQISVSESTAGRAASIHLDESGIALSASVNSRTSKSLYTRICCQFEEELAILRKDAQGCKVGKAPAELLTVFLLFRIIPDAQYRPH